jgi:hypothetical protein
MQHPCPQLGQIRPRALLYVSQARNGKQHVPQGTNWDKHALITGNGEEPVLCNCLKRSSSAGLHTTVPRPFGAPVPVQMLWCTSTDTPTLPG